MSVVQRFHDVSPHPPGRIAKRREFRRRVASRSAASEHAFPALAIAVVTLFFVWLVIAGSWRLFEREEFSQFYDCQARSMVHGRWDVPRAGIQFEAFIRDGKYYGYFGFAPALPRMVLDAFFRPMWGRWNRLSLAIACIVTLVYAYVLLRTVRQSFVFPNDDPMGSSTRADLAAAGFVLAVGLGTSLSFLASRAWIYHEAIIWGSALAIGCYAHVLRYLRRPAATDLAAACLIGFLAFFSRMSVGSGALAAMGMLGSLIFLSRSRFGAHHTFASLHRWRTPPPLLHSAATCLCTLLAAGLYVQINHAKFGTLLDGMPFRLYRQFHLQPYRLLYTDGKSMSMWNLRTNADAYFSPRSVIHNEHFPWIWPEFRANFYPESQRDLVEPFMCIPISTPALATLSLIGASCLIVRLRRPHAGDGRDLSAVIPSAGALLGCLPVLLSASISERYTHDFLPELVVLGAIGLNVLLAVPNARFGRRLLAGIATLTLVSIYINTAFSVEYQRTMTWYIDDDVAQRRKAEFMHWQQMADTSVGISPEDHAEPVSQTATRF